jgi:hypothetical protein
MKTYNIELQRVKSMSNSHGLIHVRIDAAVQPQSPRHHADEEGEAHTVLSLTEDNARVMLLLLKAQIAEFDKRKPRSRF